MEVSELCKKFLEKFKNKISDIKITSDSADVKLTDIANKEDIKNIQNIFLKLINNKYLNDTSFSLWIDDVCYKKTLIDDIFEKDDTVKKRVLVINEVVKNTVIKEVEKVVEVTKEVEVPHLKRDKNTDYPKLLLDNNLFIEKDDKGNYKINLVEYGLNNTQIFTREEDIKKMVNSIGYDYIINPETTILEPTSGDGAFTVRILQWRLEKIIKDSQDENSFILNSLKALSTIYSIEYEDVTCYTQRCNLYSAMLQGYKNYFDKNNIEDKTFNKKWEEITKNIIFSNIIWGAFAATNDPEYTNFDTILGFDRASGRPLNVIKWNLSMDKKGNLKYKKEIIS